MGRVGAGVGDMKKAVYDPDKDGVIALAQRILLKLRYLLFLVL